MASNRDDPGRFSALADSKIKIKKTFCIFILEDRPPTRAPECARPDRSVISCPDLACIENEAPIPFHHPSVGAIFSVQARYHPPS